MKQLIRFLLALLFFRTGMVALYRRRRSRRKRHQPLVLTYHGVDDRENLLEMFMPTDLFEGQLSHLARHYEVIGTDDMAAWLDGERGIDPGAVVITFDDGYADNFANALPILEKYGLLATIFVSTDFVESGITTPVDRLLRAVENARVTEVSLGGHGLGPFAMDEPAERRRCVAAMDHIARDLRGRARDSFIDNCIRACGLEPDDEFFNGAMMTWDQVRLATERGITIGAHTQSHPFLSKLDGADLVREIEGSKGILEAALGRPCRHFAYPFGSPDAVTQDVIDATVRAGYDTAFVLYRNPVTRESRMELGRRMISIDLVEKPWGGFSESMFACEVSGLFDRLLR